MRDEPKESLRRSGARPARSRNRPTNPRREGAGSLLSYISYIGVWFLSRFGLKIGIDFDHAFCSQIGFVLPACLE